MFSFSFSKKIRYQNFLGSYIIQVKRVPVKATGGVGGGGGGGGGEGVGGGWGEWGGCGGDQGLVSPSTESLHTVESHWSERHVKMTQTDYPIRRASSPYRIVKFGPF